MGGVTKGTRRVPSWGKGWRGGLEACCSPGRGVPVLLLACAVHYTTSCAYHGFESPQLSQGLVSSNSALIGNSGGIDVGVCNAPFLGQFFCLADSPMTSCLIFHEGLLPMGLCLNWWTPLWFLFDPGPVYVCMAFSLSQGAQACVLPDASLPHQETPAGGVPWFYRQKVQIQYTTTIGRGFYLQIPGKEGVMTPEGKPPSQGHARQE